MSAEGLRSAPWERWSPWAVLFVPVCAGVLVALGYLLGEGNAKYAIAGAGAIFAIGLWAADPIFPVIIVLPATLLVMRLGGGGTNLSVSDFVLFFGTMAALPAVRWADAPRLKRLIAYDVFYQAMLIPVVLYHPTKLGIIEWFHELFLVSGSLIVGWVLADRDRMRTALGLYVLGAAGIALWTTLVFVKHHLHSAELPFGMQKNYIGDMLSFAVLISFVNPPWAHLKGKWVKWCTYICGVGILASGSRQAVVGVVVALFVIIFRGGNLSRRAKRLMVALVPLGIISYITLTHEISSSNKFNSVHQRISWYGQAFSLWKHYPIFGAGLRFFFTGQYSLNIQPPNSEMEMLTSAGVVGLLAFWVLAYGLLRHTWTLPKSLGTLGLALVVCRLVQVQLDVTWVAAQNSFPWMVAGLSIGMADRLLGKEPAPQRGLLPNPDVGPRARFAGFRGAST